MLSTSAAFHVETCVIGAGVIGLAVARALTNIGKEVLLLEKEATIGSQTSSRNSEVIHAGIYYPVGSMKAKLCVRGKKLLYEYCQERAIPHRQLGKLIVATDPKQMKDDIPKIMERASLNGVQDLILLPSGEDVSNLYESQVTCHGALFSPSTGVLDSHSYMVALQADAENHGMTLALNSPVSKCYVMNDGKIMVESEEMELICDTVVNCAGLYADKIANMIIPSRIRPKFKHDSNRSDKDDAVSPSMENQHENRQFYAKGNYYRLEGKSPFHHLVYPVPKRGGLGVHATIDLGGNTRFGPDVEWMAVDKQDPGMLNLSVDPKRSEAFYAEVRKYWPSLQDGALQPDYAGIRPKLGHPSVVDGPSINADFLIQGSSFHGIKGFVNLMGIESPGLTASMAIGEEVVAELVKDGSI